MEKFIKIGQITKPQGIRGEVKVNPITDDVKRFLNLKKVLIDGKEYKVLQTKIGADAVFIALGGINDRNSAELLRGKFLSVSREDAVPLKEDAFFIEDVKGCSLLTEDGECMGKITEITGGRTDVFTVETVSGKTMRFPFLKDLLVSVDLEGQKITVNKKRLSEVSCYED